ncbi:MAG: putative integral rane protein, partial [Mucilaginibacter sp.]|nr:putative integral rane protein [Mucilaginibacter sp.]
IVLGSLSDKEYLAAMQSINSAIQNHIFFLSFLGTLFLLPLSTYLNYEQPLSIRFFLLLAAAVIYAIGVFGITIFGNVPLNEALANFNLEHASVKSINDQRIQFERPWLLFHQIRTIASVVCLILVIISCCYKFDPKFPLISSFNY